MSFDPWTALRQEWPGVQVFIRCLRGKYGQTVWDDGAPHIELDLGLDRVQQRVTLTHEIGHLVHGPPGISLCARNESQVVEWTARTLLPDLDLIGDMLRTSDVARVARALDVTIDILADRLAGLTEAERAQLAVHIPDGNSDARVAAHA